MTVFLSGTLGRVHGPLMSAANVVIAFAALTWLGCGGAAAGSEKGTVPSGSKAGPEALSRNCTDSGDRKEETDLDGDGRPEIRHVYKGSTKVCSEFDPDRNGTIDSRRFYGANGEPEYDQVDSDHDGKIDELAFYENGQLVRKEMDMNWDSRIDTWMWCDGDVVSKLERDTSSDGAADSWEEYEDGVITLAAYDEDHSGKPERWEHFESGRLVKVQYDLDADGKPDREEVIPAAERGEPDDRLACVEIPDEARSPAVKSTFLPEDAPGEKAGAGDGTDKKAAADDAEASKSESGDGDKTAGDATGDDKDNSEAGQ